MSQNPYESPKTPSESMNGGRGVRWDVTRIVAVVGGGAVGFMLGYGSLVLGSAAGITWPAVVLCAPATLIAFSICGDSVVGAVAMLVGSTLLYATYFWLAVSVRKGRILFAALFLHIMAALILYTVRL